MMKLKVTLFGVLTAVSLGVVAPYANAEMNCGTLADFYLEYAKPKGDASRNWFKDGYFMGFVRGYVLGDAGRDYEMPHGVTAEQVSRVVGTFLSSNRQMWHLPMWDCVHRALLEAWPPRK